MYVRIVVSALGLAAIGCGGSANQFRADAYYHETQSYRVVYREGTDVLPSASWVVDNYQVGKDGKFAERKVGPKYETKIRMDTDGDGDMDITHELSKFDLLLRHRKNDGRIWVRTFPVSDEFRETDLRVLALNYVDAVSGSGEVVINLGDGAAVRSEKRFATRVLSSAAATLDGYPAFDVTFEVANVDQLKLSESSRWERARLVVVRPPIRLHKRGADFAVLMVLAYTNRPEDFDASVDDFEHLLSSVDVLGDRELVLLKADDLKGCAAGEDALVVRLRVGAEGAVERAVIHPPDQPEAFRAENNYGKTCAENKLGATLFPATGEVRLVNIALNQDTAPSPAQGYVRGEELEIEPGSTPAAATQATPTQAAPPTDASEPPAGAPAEPKAPAAGSD